MSDTYLTCFLREAGLLEAWQARYIRGEIGVDELEAGLERALTGAMSEEELVGLLRELSLHQGADSRPGGIILYDDRVGPT